MKKYRLKKDLPTFKAGEKFAIPEDGGGLWKIDGYDERGEWYGHICAYSKSTLEKFPNILEDWFEEIPEKPKTIWDLKNGDECWLRSTTLPPLYETPLRPEKTVWDDSSVALCSLRECGGVFLTREDCRRDIEWQIAYQILLRDTKGFKPDWNNADQTKYHVAYNYGTKNFWIDCNWSQAEGAIYFASTHHAQASIEYHKKEWLTYLGVEE